MSRATADDQLKFLLSCVKHANAGKIDFVEVAQECGIVSKGAAAKRFERLMKANGIHTGGSEKQPSTPREKSRPEIARAAAAKRRKIEGDHFDMREDDEEMDVKPVLPKPEFEQLPIIKTEGDTLHGHSSYPVGYVSVSNPANQVFMQQPPSFQGHPPASRNDEHVQHQRYLWQSMACGTNPPVGQSFDRVLQRDNDDPVKVEEDPADDNQVSTVETNSHSSQPGLMHSLSSSTRQFTQSAQLLEDVASPRADTQKAPSATNLVIGIKELTTLAVEVPATPQKIMSQFDETGDFRIKQDPGHSRICDHSTTPVSETAQLSTPFRLKAVHKLGDHIDDCIVIAD